MPHPVLLLAGPTASGKTALIQKLAQRKSQTLEVVSSDAYQVYRGLDIGTAKPEAELRQLIHHHLVDILDPHESYSVADFVRDATQALHEIRQRGRIPVVCGGTAYYLKHLMQGLPNTPVADLHVRQKVEELYAQEGQMGLLRRLQLLDPDSAARIHPNDVYRLKRALEVFEQSGKALSSYRMPEPQAARGKHGYRTLATVPDFFYNFTVLSPPRELLKQRIRQRVEHMLRAGLAKEVHELAVRGLDPRYQALQAIGYQEFFIQNQAQGSEAAPGHHTLRETSWQFRQDDEQAVAEQIILHSQQYAKRQMTFFKSLQPDAFFEDQDVAWSSITSWLDGLGS